MSTKLTSLGTTHCILLVRSFVVILGCIALWWGIVEFPVFWQESSTERLANRIIAGEPFKAEILTRQLPIIDDIERSPYCRPAALRSAAIVQLRMVEATTSENDSEHFDEHLKSLGNVIRSSLSCSPADPFLWLALYWVENTHHGATADYLKYLQLSYRLGPNEGWIAVKRNALTFAIFAHLPADLAESAVNEFVEMLKSGFAEQAVEIFVGPAWQVRKIIIPRLKVVEERHLRRFSNILFSRGYDVAIPGIDRSGSRPWN